MAQRCTEEHCTGRAAAIIVYNNDAPARYCKLCLEVFLVESLQALDFGDTLMVQCERAGASNTLPIYKVVA